MMWNPFRRRPTPEQLRASFDVDASLTDLLRVVRTWNKPRGLTWLAIHATGAPILVRTPDASPMMLLPVEIRFEVVPGSDMEDVPHAREPRQATALFLRVGPIWTPADRMMMNLTPAETLERNSGWIAEPK